MESLSKRNKGLDVLRTIAVVLVIIRHGDLPDNFLKNFGWLGVDLFFVLSGFLISGILFVEYKKEGRIDIKRFLFRRSFKIFPPFYFFLVVTLFAYYYFEGITYPVERILPEVFYLQTYVSRIWNHTWSLALEEHFYLVFSLIMYILYKTKSVEKKRSVVITLLILLFASFLLRTYLTIENGIWNRLYFVYTHHRLDGVLMGVLLSYLYHFTGFIPKLLRYKVVLLIISFLLILPGFIFKAGYLVMNSVGLTTVNLGFSILILLFLDVEKYIGNTLLKYPLVLLSFIGMNSYSIYLWHLNSKKIVHSFLTLNPYIMTVLYGVVSIVLGIVMSYLIERSALKIRDRFVKSSPIRWLKG